MKACYTYPVLSFSTTQQRITEQRRRLTGVEGDRNGGGSLCRRRNVSTKSRKSQTKELKVTYACMVVFGDLNQDRGREGRQKLTGRDWRLQEIGKRRGGPSEVCYCLLWICEAVAGKK